MAHAKSLRVIGQLLEAVKIQTFELKTDGPNYVVQSDLLTPASSWILRHTLDSNRVSEESAHHPTISRSVRLALADISEFDQAQKQKRMNPSAQTQIYGRLSQLLRALGDHLDRTEVDTFHLSWTGNSASVDFQSPDGRSDSRSFTADRLERLGSHSRILRSSGVRSDTNLSASVKQRGPRNR